MSSPYSSYNQVKKPLPKRNKVLQVAAEALQSSEKRYWTCLSSLRILYRSLFASEVRYQGRFSTLFSGFLFLLPVLALSLFFHGLLGKFQAVWGLQLLRVLLIEDLLQDLDCLLEVFLEESGSWRYRVRTERQKLSTCFFLVNCFPILQTLFLSLRLKLITPTRPSQQTS